MEYIDSTEIDILDIEGFLLILKELYNPDFDENGNWKVKYAVKFYAQAETFSYEIFTQDQAFIGKPVFTSKVFYFWMDNIKEIMVDIKYNLENETWID